MKIPFAAFLFGCVALFPIFPIQASGEETNVFAASVSQDIPDDSNTGVIDIITVPEKTDHLIQNVTLSLSLDVPPGSTGFTGDLYAYVQHGQDVAVLLNRPGRGAVGSSGYNDNISFSITFADDAPNGDIHNYRLAINGDHDTPLTVPLTGLWQADARPTDPASVLLNDPRTANLEVFDGADPSGEWTLFAADLSSGGQHRIVEWSVTITTIVIPEPAASSLAAAGLLFVVIQRATRLRASARSKRMPKETAPLDGN